jgi:hypothetical protein
MRRAFWALLMLSAVLAGCAAPVDEPGNLTAPTLPRPSPTPPTPPSDPIGPPPYESPPGLSLEVVPDRWRAPPDDPIRLTLVLRNDGGPTYRYAEGCLARLDVLNDTFALVRTVVEPERCDGAALATLAPGQEIWANVTWPGGPVGSAYLRAAARVQAPNGTWTYTAAHALVRVFAPLHLRVTLTLDRTAIAPGGHVNATVNVTNLGPKNATFGGCPGFDGSVSVRVNGTDVPWYEYGHTSTLIGACAPGSAHPPGFMFTFERGWNGFLDPHPLSNWDGDPHDGPAAPPGTYTVTASVQAADAPEPASANAELDVLPPG